MLSQYMEYLEKKGMKELGNFITNGALSEDAGENLRTKVREMFSSNKDRPYKEATKVAILSNLDDVLPPPPNKSSSSHPCWREGQDNICYRIRKSPK